MKDEGDGQGEAPRGGMAEGREGHCETPERQEALCARWARCQAAPGSPPALAGHRKHIAAAVPREEGGAARASRLALEPQARQDKGVDAVV
jgi:hypothetical protein